MCGIAGYLDTRGAAPEQAVVAEMVRRIAHRGPDDTKVSVVSNGDRGHTVVFGHARLSIVDLSDAGAQPMSCGEYLTLTYNGEIYNHRELRSQLEGKGHVFRSASDTEVILHAYDRYGDDFVNQLDGMFAFALWDARRHRLVLGRDRVGKKPLFFSWDGARLTFASETKALRACSWVDTSIDWSVVPGYLSMGSIASPRTMHESVEQVPPAATMTCDSNGILDTRRYWQLPSPERYSSTSVAEAGERVRETLWKAVEKRLFADVPVGLLLSGGLDSSAIAAVMAEHGLRPRTFTVSVGGEAGFDELPYARRVAELFGTNHVELTVNDDVTDLLDDVVWHLDQPMADSSAVPTFLVAREARRHVKVALNGDGGDEVFGGYERFRAALVAERVPRVVQRSAARAGSLVPSSDRYFDLRSRAQRFGRAIDMPLFDRYLSWMTIFKREELSRLLPSLDGPPQLEGLREVWEAPARSTLDRLLRVNFVSYLHDDLLVKADRMSMANSLEARSPFLDVALIEVANSLPDHLKTSAFGTKRILKRALRDLLPKDIVHRRKHGFGVPVAAWFRGRLKEPLEDLVLQDDARIAEVVSIPAVRELYRAHLQGHDHGARLWALLVLEGWLRTNEQRSEGLVVG